MGYRKLKKGEKLLICQSRRDGCTISEIARSTGRCWQTIWRVLRRNLGLPADQVTGQKFSSGRPPKLTPRAKRLMGRTIMKKPFLTAAELKAKYPSHFSHVSNRTMQRVARDELKLPIWKTAAKPLLTVKMVRKRLKFCRQYKEFTPEQ